MLAELLLVAALAASPATDALASNSPSEAVPEQDEQIGALLVERLTEICLKHPEVERAFLLSKPSSGVEITYMFVPIFDREVSDEVLDEADAAYKQLAPNGPGLGVMLLARNSWKTTLGTKTPFYVRKRE